MIETNNQTLNKMVHGLGQKLEEQQPCINHTENIKKVDCLTIPLFPLVGLQCTNA